MERDFDLKYKLFRIPQTDLQEGVEPLVVGVIDASGSMGDYWNQMTKFWNATLAEKAQFIITFSTTAKIEQKCTLSDDLKKHGGYTTSICRAFMLLQQKLKTIKIDIPITIIFISDGNDTVSKQKIYEHLQKNLKGGNGRYINFICLGIHNQFPTKIGMSLRKLYHNGDQNVPAVYVIQYASQKAFFNKFQSMNRCFIKINTMTIPMIKQLIQYPWVKNQPFRIVENKWILVPNQYSQIQIIYNQKTARLLQIPRVEEIGLEDLVDCFRGWVQKIQLLSIQGCQTKRISQIALDFIKAYTLQYQIKNKLYIIRQMKVEEKESFQQRAKNLVVKNIGKRINWFIDQLAIISKGVAINLLNQEQAAKRLGIGTITGKYHQKALALKGITLKQFEKIKEQFKIIYHKVRLSAEQSKQQPSIFTYQNQKEIFQEQDLIIGLDYCKSQFDFVQTFPVVGYGLKVKRSDGSMINPWKVRILKLAKHHRTIDSMYLARNSNKYEFSIGKDEKQQINAVLPLFTLEDIQMCDLLNTRLFRLAVSFMVVQNIDTYHDQAYMALLGNTLIFLLKQQQSNWRNELMNHIYSSMKITYGMQTQFCDQITLIKQNPFNLFNTKGQQYHVDIVKVMLLCFYISKEQILDKEDLNHLVDLCLVHYTEKSFVENQFDILRIIQLEDDAKEIYKHQKQEEYKQQNIVKDDAHLKIIVNQQMQNLNLQKVVKIKINDKIFIHQEQDKRVHYKHIQNFYQLIKEEKLKNRQILFHFAHYLKGKNSKNYNSPIIRDKNNLKEICLQRLGAKQKMSQITRDKLFTAYKRAFQQKHLQIFRQTHFNILPIQEKELQILCKQRNIPPQVLNRNPKSGLIRNACMSRRCKYFLQPMKAKEIHDHLKLWRKQIPVKFHLYAKARLQQGLSVEQTCKFFFNSGLINEKKHKKDKQFVTQYIKKIKQSLNLIKNK